MSVLEPITHLSLNAGDVGHTSEVIVPMLHRTLCDNGDARRARETADGASAPTFTNSSMVTAQDSKPMQKHTIFSTESASVVNSGGSTMNYEFMSKLAQSTVPIEAHHSKVVQRMRLMRPQLHRVPEASQPVELNHDVMTAFHQWNGCRCHSRASESSTSSESTDIRAKTSSTSSTLSNIHRIPSNDSFDNRFSEFDVHSIRSAERCKTPLFRKDSEDVVVGIPLVRSHSAPNALFNTNPFHGPVNGMYATTPCISCKRYTVFYDYDRYDGSSSCDSCGVVQPNSQKISRNRNGGGDEQEDKTVRGDAYMPYAAGWSKIRSKRDLNAAERMMNGHQSTCVPSKLESAQNSCISRSKKQWDEEHQSSKTDHQKRVDLIVVQTITELHSLVDNPNVIFNPNKYLVELIESTIRRFADSYVSHRLVCTNKSKCFLMDDWKTKVVMAVCASVCIEDCIRQTQEDTSNSVFKNRSWGNVDLLRSMLVFIQSKIGKGRTMEAENTCKLARDLFDMTDPSLPCIGNRQTTNALQIELPTLHPNPLMRMRSESKCDSDDTSSISSRSTNQELIAINFGLGANGAGSPLGPAAAHATTSMAGMPPPPPCSPTTTSITTVDSTMNELKRLECSRQNEFVFKKALANLSKDRSLKLTRNTVQKVKEMLSNPSEIEKLIKKQQSQKHTPERLLMDLCNTVARMTVNASQFTPINQMQHFPPSEDIRGSPTKRVKTTLPQY